MRSRVGRRTDQRLIHPDRLRELEQLAQDGQKVRQAIGDLQPERYRQMEVARESSNPLEVATARGWLMAWDALGERLARME